MIIQILLWIVVGIGVLLLSRELVIWYYRIDDVFKETSEIKALHEQQIELQKEILEILKSQMKDSKE